MLRTVWFYMVLVISVLFTSVFLPLWHILGWLGMNRARQMLGHYVSYFWARLIIIVVGIDVTIQGLDNVPKEGAVVFVGNHQSNFDIAVLLGCINKSKGFLAKKELSIIPIIRSWMNKIECVFIDRGNLRQSVKAIQKCIDVLKNGQSMVVFPEGTRSRGPLMGAFKKGSLRIVEKSGVPVVPVTVNGTYRIMEANNSRIKPASVTVNIAPPIYYESLSKEEQRDIHIIIREAIAANLSE